MKMNIICTLVFASMLLGFNSCQESTERLPGNNDFKWLETDIISLQEEYRNGNHTVEEVVQSFMDRIEAIDRKGPSLHAVVTINPDALEIARKLDADLASGKQPGPLFGIPVLLKDNIDTHDRMPCTAGSLALKDSYPLKDAFLVKQLREADAVILGKANLSEWANFRGELSSSGWSAVGGQTKNPYVLDRNPCGSSSGSGVSVAANLTVLAIGTETNGSIVCPSNNNGIVGIKPTVGLISRSGIIPISFSQDTGGPMARSVSDAVICLGTMTAIDTSDDKTLDSHRQALSDYTPFLKPDGLQNKRIGIFTGPLNKSFRVDSLFDQAVNLMKSQGAEIVEIAEILQPETGSLSFDLMLYEYKDGLNKYFASLGPEAPVKTLEELIEFNKRDPVELKNYDQRYLEQALTKAGINSAEYLDLRTRMWAGSRENGIDRVMNVHQLDAIVAPTGSPAWKTDLINGDNYLLSSSSPAAISGYPNITVPMGFVGELPVNLSIFGRAWSEPVLIEIAYAYEQATRYRKAPKFLETYMP